MAVLPFRPCTIPVQPSALSARSPTLSKLVSQAMALVA
jgi:hypothetical protein